MNPDQRSIAARLGAMCEPPSRLPACLAIPTLAEAGCRVPDVQVRPPGSKSLTNRALLLGALCDGTSTLTDALTDADDARQMIDALRTLGAGIAVHESTVRVTGVNGRWKTPPGGVHLQLNNAGTAVRFLAGAALLATSPITIDGNGRMRQRPIGELGDLLTALGAGVTYCGREECPPIRITPSGQPPRGVLHIGPTLSSQFVSALLLAAPWLEHGLTIKLDGQATSESYITMTLTLLARLGAVVQTSADQRLIRVLPGGIRAFSYEVEPDASGATYFWTAAAMVPEARVTVNGLDSASLQGDAAFPKVLRRMGATVTECRGPQGSIRVIGPPELAPVQEDMSDMPDAAMSVAVAACFARGESMLRGLGTLRVKETDRIEALRRELSKLGVAVCDVEGDRSALIIRPPRGGVDCGPGAPCIEFETYDDHRMAMSLALIGLVRPNVAVLNPACVAKTYPTFWADFATLFAGRADPA